MLEEIERARKEALRKTLLCASLIFVLALIVVLLTRAIQISFFFFVFGIIITTLVSAKSKKEFQDLYKKYIVLETFKTLCTNVEFDLDKGIARNVIASTRMMNMGDDFYSNDYVRGKYKEIPFESSDVRITETHTDSDGDTHTTTLFMGQWYIFDFNKSFKADLQVCDKRFTNARRGGLFSKQKFHKVELEDIDFNKKFRVYAESEMDAFYVLTPHTMERIKELKAKVKGKLLFCFIDDKIHIGVSSNKDMYEASIFKKVDLDRAIEKTKEEISVITDFVDILRLDNDLFKNSKEVE